MMDRCNTPAYALDPLLPFLPLNRIVWESAAGTGNFIDPLSRIASGVIATDVFGAYANPPRSFFTSEPRVWDCNVTNPPYSVKFQWIERCYALGKPFALLLPVETIGAQRAQESMQRYGCELLLLNRRVNFQMPNKGWEGSSAQFPVLWFCWRLLPQPIMYGNIERR